MHSRTLSLTRERMNKGVGTELDVARAQAQVSETAAMLPLSIHMRPPEAREDRPYSQAAV